MAREAQNYSELRKRILDASPETLQILQKTANKRRISLMLARMRAKKNLAQKDIADLAHLDKSVVSKLESAQSGIPDLLTLARFAEACGMTLGLVAIDKEDVQDIENLKHYHIVDAVTLAASDDPISNVFSFLRGRSLPYAPNDEAHEEE